MPDVIVAGHLCLDLIPGLREGGLDLEPGKLRIVGGATFATGGGVSNVGLALRKLGVDAALVGKIGEDVFGRAVRDILEHYAPGASQALSVSQTEATSYTLVMSPPGSDRSFLHHPGCNDSFIPGDIDLEALGTARLLYFGYPPLMRQIYEDGGKELASLFEKAQAKGITTALDMTLPDPNATSGRVDWAAFLARVLPFTDVFVPSLPELLFMLERNTYDRGNWEPANAAVLDRLTDRLLELGVAVAGLKLGSEGLYLKTAALARLEKMNKAAPHPLPAWAERELWSPVFQVDVAGTVGAGDATLAGLIAALLEGLSPEDALNTACAVGACSVEAVDAVSGVRSWQEVQTRIEGGWARASLIHKGWHAAASGVYSRG